jgi:hypothetical protein
MRWYGVLACVPRRTFSAKPNATKLDKALWTEGFEPMHVYALTGISRSGSTSFVVR